MSYNSFIPSDSIFLQFLSDKIQLDCPLIGLSRQKNCVNSLKYALLVIHLMLSLNCRIFFASLVNY
jgi:hypothetical protein